MYRAIEELERFQAGRKARGESAASTDAQLAQPPAEMNEGQPEKQGSRAFEDSENGVGKVEAAWRRGYTTPARAACESDFAKRTHRALAALIERRGRSPH